MMLTVMRHEVIRVVKSMATFVDMNDTCIQ